MPMPMTAPSAVAVTTAAAVVAVADLADVMIAVVHLRAVMAPEAVRVVTDLVEADFAQAVDREASAVMAMTAADRRAVLVIVIVAARRSASGWRFQRMCR